jgi:dTDP-4-dehydrorhamnose reductase
VLLGGSGLAGSALRAVAPVPLIVPLRAELDLADLPSIQPWIERHRPAVVINAAGWSNVDEAESHEGLAFRINADAVGALAAACDGVDALLVHFSSDYVFDGRAAEPYDEDAPPHPINAYGRSKVAGEEAVRRATQHLLVRTHWLFGDGGRSFPATMLERARRGVPSRVVDDQWGSPTSAADLAAALWTLLAREARGLLHVRNSGETSWFEVARAVYARAGDVSLVTACTSAEYPLAAARPRRTLLATARADALLGAPLPHWSDALARFLDHRLGAV